MKKNNTLECLDRVIPKFNLKMKLTVFFLIITFFQMQANSGYAQKTKISLDLKEASLTEVFTIIESKTEFKFFYKNEAVNLNRKITIQAKKERIRDILDVLFKDSSVIYEVIGKQIVIKKLTPPKYIEKSEKDDLQSQDIIIKGTINDESGQPLPGANILEKGTTNGTQSDFDGNFSLTVTDPNATLIISYIGFLTNEVALNGQTSLTIALVEDAASLEEVVVTALGIKKEKRGLGYAVTSISEETLEESGETNVIEALTGKVPGLAISGQNGLSDSGSSIVIRGHSSIQGNSQALIVVDGVPRGLNVIPTDIESISVLRGANASALYGSQGANGVILITTKSGKKNQGLSVEINSSLIVSNVTKLPQLQNEWGQGKTTLGQFQGMGDDGIPLIGGGNKDETWGPRYEGQDVRINWLREQPVVAFLPQPNNIRNLFNTGFHSVNNIALSNGGEKTSYYASFQHQNADEYIPTAKTQRTLATLRVTHQITDKLYFDAKMDWDNNKGYNRPDEDDHNSALNLATHPRSIRLSDISRNGGMYPVSGQDWGEARWADGQPILWTTTSNVDQYYWNLYQDSKNDWSQGTNINLSMNYKITDWLDVMLRYNHSETNGGNNRIKAIGSWKTKEGSYAENQGSGTSRKTYFLFTGNKDFLGGDLNINGNIGGEQTYNTNSGINLNGVGFVIPGIETYNNTLTKTSALNKGKGLGRSLYGTVQFGYKRTLYLDVTARNDWTSSLPLQNNSYFYPSFTGSFVFSEVLGIDKDILSFGKIRASYAEVGAGGGGNFIKTYGFGISTMGALTMGTSGTLPFYNLKPERTESTEFGLELWMLRNRIKLDATYYKANSFNQILGSQPLATSSTFNGETINGGNIENKGVELMLTAIPVKTDNFSWETNIIYTKNESTVIDLGDQVDTQIDFGGNGAVRIVAIPGNSLRTITGQGFQRNDQGQILIKTDGSDRGIAMQTDEYLELGKVEPDWTGSVRNTFSYKNIRLYAQVDGSFGGQVFGSNNMAYDEQGNSVRSLNGRDGWIQSELDKDAGLSDGFTGGVDIWVDNNTVLYDESLFVDGVQQGGVANSGENAIYSDPRKFWDRNRNDRAEHNIEDASYVKLREIGLSYAMPEAFLAKTPFQAMNFTLVGNNLALLYSKARHFDPEAYRTNNGKSALGYTSYTPPPVRTISFKLQLKF